MSFLWRKTGTMISYSGWRTWAGVIKTWRWNIPFWRSSWLNKKRISKRQRTGVNDVTIRMRRTERKTFTDDWNGIETLDMSITCTVNGQLYLQTFCLRNLMVASIQKGYTIGSLSKPRGRELRKRHQKKDLRSSINNYAHALFIFLHFFAVFCKRTT